MFMYPHESSDKIHIDKETKIHSLEDLPNHSIKRGFEYAMRASLESEWYQTRDRMGATIFAGNRLIATGSNSLVKSKPGNRFTKVLTNGKVVEYMKSIHAEQAALVKIKHYEYERQKLSMFVYRENSKGIMSASFPCPMCQEALRKSDISVVYFITPDNYLGVWRL